MLRAQDLLRQELHDFSGFECKVFDVSELVLQELEFLADDHSLINVKANGHLDDHAFNDGLIRFYYITDLFCVDDFFQIEP